LVIGKYITEVKSLEDSISSSGEKGLGEDSLRTLQSLAWVSKEYNIQDRVGAWDVDVGLPNHVKNWVCNFYLYTFYFKHFNYIVG